MPFIAVSHHGVIVFLFFLDDVIMCLFACVLYCAWHWVKVVCSTQSLLSMPNIYIYVCMCVLLY